MRAKLRVILYLCLVDVVAVFLIVSPAYAFLPSQSTTGYVRRATASAVTNMMAAQRVAAVSSLGSSIAASTGGSIALRLVASSVGWPVLGVVAGITLAMVYYNATQAQSARDRAAHPGAVMVPGVTGELINTFTYLGVEYVVYGNAAIPNGCSNTTYLQLLAAGYAGPLLISNTNPPTSGTYCAMQKGAAASGAHASVGAPTPATASELSTFVGGLPASDPLSIESNTQVVGSGVSPTPADVVTSQPVPATDLTTQVVPATQVQPTDVVVDPNATKPAGTETTETKTQTTTTTTTTTTNPDGSTTEEQSDTAPVTCTAGNHEQRSFGSILQDHMDLWQGSGLLSALTLLKTLAWPTAMPTYSLQSNLLGNFTLDFSAWSGMLTAIRSIIIAIAGFVAYRIVFVGAR